MWVGVLDHDGQLALPTIEERRRKVRLRRGLLFGIVMLLGAATIILPAIASSETSPTVRAYSYRRLGTETHDWLPQAAQVRQGGTVNFTNPSSLGRPTW